MSESTAISRDLHHLPGHDLIAEQREQLAANGNVVSIPSSVVAGLEIILLQIDHMPDPLMSHILLECADEIRKLHVLSTKIE